MGQRLEQFFSTNFMAPHGYCFLWLPEIVWVHVVANLLIAGAYFSIPIALWRFARQRPDIPFNKIFILFAAFITLCGLTHVFGIAVLWWPAYGIEGLVMLTTGIVSATTAVFVWRIMPKALSLPSLQELLDANSQLNASYEEIEQKVRERTAELEQTNRELLLARQKADEASEAKSDFLANMSHEIRTPMNAVVGITDLLRRSQPLTQQQHEYISTLQMSGTALLALLNDLLDIEKIEAHTSELEHVPFSVAAVVEETVRVMQMRADEKNISFTSQSDCAEFEQRQYIGDPNRLRQVLMNLCSNALKFTSHGGVSIHTACAPDGPNRELVTIAVEDTGIGIAPENHARVFEKFVQADTSISRRYGGTGLGLSIVKTLVELMDGTITLESTPGIGTRIMVTLPLEVTTSTTVPTTAMASTAPLTASVLLVEDYLPNVLVATTYLAQLGLSYDTAESGTEAVEKFSTGRYGLILMDVQMPGMSGFEATKHIRAHERQHNMVRTPIIGLTAHAMTGDRQRCYEAGMDDYLPKPYSPETLQERISKFLKD